MRTTDDHEADRTPPAIDRERLRRDRLARALDAMGRRGLDALVLGREGNARYVSDAQRLWLAGPRPFGPVCIVVRATGAVHVLSTSSAGVPATIPHENLYPLSWNPEIVAARLARIGGLSDARTIGVDGWSPAAARLLARVAPHARIADGDAALREARSVKTADEVAAIRAAADVARRGLAAARRALAARPAAIEPELRAAFVAEVAARGVTTPAFDAVVHHAVRGPLVALRCGVLRDGYEATLIRTVARAGGGADEQPAAAREARARCAALHAALLAACRAGAGARELLGAFDGAGVVLPAFPIAHGVGLGAEPPLVGAHHTCDPDWRIASGMVLALHAHVALADGTGCSVQDVVHVGPGGGEILTSGPEDP